MTFDEFDQTQNQGWRLLAHQGDCAGAAQLIESYLRDNPGLEDWQIRTLHFHAVQMHAFAGATEQALQHLPFSLEPDEAPDAPIRWNDYVAATESFLLGDLPGLLSARERVAQGQIMPNGKIANLGIVDSLITHFGKPYSEAY